MSPLLDRQFGTPRSPQQAQRNLEALGRLQRGELRRGELYRLVLGIPLRDPAAAPVTAATGVALCVDCGLPVDHAGEQLAQLYTRCRPCGTKKRREWSNRPRKTTG